MKQLERIRCTKCGADFEHYDPDARFMQCESCGATFVIQQAEKFARVEADQQQIIKLRRLLQDAIDQNHVQRMAQYAIDIRKLVPEDALAAYCEALGNKSSALKRYTAHLCSISAMTEEEAAQILEIALRESNFSMHDEKPLQAFVKSQFPDQVQADKMKLIQQAVNALFEATNRYSNVPRDVFICHSSDDPIAQEVEKMLWEDGVRCWISTRNLPPDTIYYWEYIYKALESCKIILVIASKNSMLKWDPVKEMEYAREQGLKLLEFKVDDYQHTEFFRHYFDGISWVKLTHDKQASFAELRERVYHLLHPVGQQSSLPAEPPPQVSPGTNNDVLSPQLDIGPQLVLQQKETSSQKHADPQTAAVTASPKEAVKVQVLYINRGNLLTISNSTLVCQSGEHVIDASQQQVPKGMTLVGESSKLVIVKDGEAQPNPVLFYLDDGSASTVKTQYLLESNKTPREIITSKQEVIIQYLDENKQPVAAEQTLHLLPGKHKVNANPNKLPAQFLPTGPTQKTIQVSNQTDSPQKLIFWYKVTPGFIRFLRRISMMLSRILLLIWVFIGIFFTVRIMRTAFFDTIRYSYIDTDIRMICVLQLFFTIIVLILSRLRSAEDNKKISNFLLIFNTILNGFIIVASSRPSDYYWVNEDVVMFAVIFFLLTLTITIIFRHYATKKLARYG